jgi:hypothetical protein
MVKTLVSCRSAQQNQSNDRWLSHVSPPQSVDFPVPPGAQKGPLWSCLLRPVVGLWQRPILGAIWLVVFPTPLKNMWVSNSWDDDPIYEMENKKCLKPPTSYIYISNSADRNKNLSIHIEIHAFRILFRWLMNFVNRNLFSSFFPIILWL